MKYVIAVLVGMVILLHQDVWNWTNKTLLFGYLPLGLAYHGAYSITAALTMALLVKFLWPAHLDEEESYTLPENAVGDEAH
jgi:hypothetical protein